MSPTFAASCVNRGAGDPLSIRFVQDLLADTTSADYARIRKAGADGINGSVTIFGPAEESFFLAEKFITCDDFDNVTGSRNPDGLPDFAGETISVTSDVANSPYSGYIGYSNEEFLKENAVRGFLDAVDTLCRANQYDKETVIRKPGSKVLVLSSSYLSAYGYYDIRTVSEASGHRIKVISPVHSMFDSAAERHGENASLAVWTTPEVLGAGVYASASSLIAEKYPSLDYEVLCPDKSDSLEERIISILRLYRASGKNEKLDAVLVDEMPLSATLLNQTMKRLEEVSDSLLAYKPILSENFEFIDAAGAVTGECIKYLRTSNQFTHRVAYPDAVFYCTIPLPGMSTDDYNEDGTFKDSFKYNRAPSSETDTYILAKMESRSVRDSILHTMRRISPKTFELYVSK